MKVYSDAALAEADASDSLRAIGVVRSPVEGIPISVKDLYDVCGDVTRAGSVALASDPPAKADATAVARLRAAGGVILGRTVTVEFAFGGVGLNPHYGTPKNPYDRASGGRIPGGSSAGAAVSVADGMVAMGLGSDTRGSVRIPAGLCGIAGFKPTQRRIPRDGCFPLSYTLDSVGPLARSIGCCAVYDAILAADGAASSAAAPPALKPSSLRLLVPRASLLPCLPRASLLPFASNSSIERCLVPVPVAASWSACSLSSCRAARRMRRTPSAITVLRRSARWRASWLCG
jgi:aspartyl-tRNA(Asn)/glutamyl-tRNA(Gln) amidotransferase subunit A